MNIKNCKRCELYKTRRNVVIGRGDLPCDILFIGEAPGRAEDMRGRAFVGPSGRVLREAIKGAYKLAHLSDGDFKMFFTNTILCRPHDENGDNRQPTKNEMEACFFNVEQIYIEAKPKVVVYIGKVAEMEYSKRIPGGVPIQHPAYILRRGGMSCPEFLTMKRKLSDIFLTIVEEVEK